jgi:hypothetical protein
MCGSDETRRTGVYTVERREIDGSELEVIVYDRRCACGNRFIETVPAMRESQPG